MTAHDYEGYRALHFDRVGDVLRIAIDHPSSDLNAVDALLHDELTRVFRELKRETRARAVLLTGRGRAFSAGGDFDWFPSLDDLEKLENL
ncbi:MAG: enoyl-CoA hydratase/isomerase family protein, partial [bacterium]|nr:enoyl-CoA hydratase/isomerase family protein [bacterium]